MRRFSSLKLQFDHLITFPAVLTVRHRIDEESPLFGMTPQDFRPAVDCSRFPPQSLTSFQHRFA
jgi:hypothetical protein